MPGGGEEIMSHRRQKSPFHSRRGTGQIPCEDEANFSLFNFFAMNPRGCFCDGSRQTVINSRSRQENLAMF